VTLEILDATGKVVGSYSSETPVATGGRGRGGRGGRGGGAAPAAGAGGAEQQFDPEAGGGGGGGRGRGGAPPPHVTKDAGMNRVVWDVRESGLSAPPGTYQARLKVGSVTETQPFHVLVDPRIAAEGVTAADLKEQFDHNVRVRELSAEAAELLTKVRAGMNGANAAKFKTIYEKLVNTPEGVRYNKPGLQSHIQYLAGMTANVDQKIGRDAIQRYAELKKEVDALKAEADRLGQLVIGKMPCWRLPPKPPPPPRYERMNWLVSSMGRCDAFAQKSIQMPSMFRYCSTFER
jgi:hypothetical protein